MTEQNYDSLEVQRTIDGAYRTVDTVFEDAYEKLEKFGRSGDKLERYRDDIEEAIGVVEGLYSTVEEGDDLVYSEDDLKDASWSIAQLENVYRRIDVPGHRPAGPGVAFRDVSNALRGVEQALNHDVLRPVRDHGDLEPLDLE